MFIRPINMDVAGGACDGIFDPTRGYVMRGGREMENHFECLWDLFRIDGGYCRTCFFQVTTVAVVDEGQYFISIPVGTTGNKQFLAKIQKMGSGL